jgi:D-glycero-beta-D-manno-heptose-7-phosphate kinase
MLRSLDLNILFNKFNTQKVLIIGDVMVDCYLWGKVNRISPEAPVPVVSDIREETRLGGAANVALNIKSMGAAPILCSVIGDDDRGRSFLELLREQNLTDLGIIVEKQRETTKKTRVISGNQHLLRVDEETSELINTDSELRLLEFVTNLINDKRVHSVIFQDYDKGVITFPIIKKVIALANKKKIPVLVDPKKRNFLVYEKATLFKPNFKELNEGLKSELDKHDLENIAGAMERLRELKKHKMIMLTLSEMGIMINEGEHYHHISAEVRDIADVSGAGDTVISIASLCLAAGLPPLDIAALSNLAGGQVCEKAGVVAINKSQLLLEAEMVRKEELEQEYRVD